jgi:DNA-binding transcriptional LysR family regulator
VGLREGRLDAAFVRPPLRTEAELAFELLESEQLVVALPSSHTLAAREEIALSELATETFILYPRSVRPGLADAVVAACEAAGFTPRVGQYAPQLSSTINLVAASLGVSIVPESMQTLQPHVVAYLPIQGKPLQASLGIAYRLSEKSAAVLNFVETARSAQRHAATRGTDAG